MTHEKLLIAVLSFALGVIVTGCAYDYRDLQRAKAAVPRPAPAALAPLICEYLRTTGQFHRGCV